jgi:hypothetical protein
MRLVPQEAQGEGGMERSNSQLPRLATCRCCVAGLTGGVGLAVFRDFVRHTFGIPPSGRQAVGGLREVLCLCLTDLYYPAVVAGGLGLAAGAAVGWWVNRR